LSPLILSYQIGAKKIKLVTNARFEQRQEPVRVW